MRLITDPFFLKKEKLLHDFFTNFFQISLLWIDRLISKLTLVSNESVVYSMLERLFFSPEVYTYDITSASFSAVRDSTISLACPFKLDELLASVSVLIVL